jgi:Tol biopolymer transport system component
MRRSLFLVAAMLAASAAWGQLTVLRIDQLTPGDGAWRGGQFSPDGATLYLSTPDQDGIWEYGLVTGKLRQLTQERGAGYGFTISPDGLKLAYIRRAPGTGRPPQREIVVRNLRAGTSRVALTGRALSLPAFSRNGATLAATETGITSTAPPDAGEVTVLGIENTKILLLRGGKKELFDPLRNGNYIWPSLSPDRTQILAYDMTIGAFLCDLQGNVLTRLGRRDAPVWTRDGRWIVYMDDRDDGDRLLSSEIRAISPDGKVTSQLTATPDRLEMFPLCSPTEDRIICSTPDGRLYSILYKEAGR